MGRSVIVPELGPLLGSLTEPSGGNGAIPALEPVRLALVGAVFERAAAARRLIEAGDERGARAQLSAAAWVGMWDDAAARSATALLQQREQVLRSAARRSAYSEKRLAPVLPSPEDRALLTARLAAAGLGLETAVPALDGPAATWAPALRRAAGELEQAWQRLADTAREEIENGDRLARAIAEWRRPWWPILVAGIAGLLLATWTGLMLGGYLPVPEPLRPVAEWVWSWS